MDMDLEQVTTLKLVNFSQKLFRKAVEILNIINEEYIAEGGEDEDMINGIEALRQVYSENEKDFFIYKVLGEFGADVRVDGDNLTLDWTEEDEAEYEKDIDEVLEIVKKEIESR